MQARAHRSIAPFDNSVQQLRHHIDRLQTLPRKNKKTNRVPGETI
jgi:hypothetical protein